MNQFVIRTICILLTLSFSTLVVGQTTWTGAGGDDSWFNTGNWDTGIVPDGNTFDAIVNSPSPTDITTADVNLNSLFVGPNGMLQIINRQLEFDGTANNTLTNQGVITSSGNSGDDLQLVRDVINSNLMIADGIDLEVADVDGADLSGGGTIMLDGARMVGVGSPAPVLTLVDQRVEGNGTILSTVELVIEPVSIVDANVNGESLTIGVGPGNLFMNSGTLQASNGGKLVLEGTSNGVNPIDNTLGIIQASDGSEVEFNRPAISGGTLQTTGNGVLRANGAGFMVFEDLTIDGNFIIENGTGNPRFAGTIDNRQTILLNSTGGSTQFDVTSGQTTTLTGGGTIQMVQNSSITRGGGSDATALILDDQTIEGEGSIANNFVMTNTSGNLIDANVAGETLQVSVGGSFTGLDSHVNRGTMRASGGGILGIGGSNNGGNEFTDFDNNGGLIQALAGSEVQFNGHVDIFGGTLASSGNGVLRNLNNTSLRLIDVVLDGNLIHDDGNTHLVGTIDNRQDMVINGRSVILDSEVTLQGGGTITLAEGTGGSTSSLGGSGLNVVNQTIEGFGLISGGDDLDIVIEENGVIEANVNGETLLINPDQIQRVDLFQNDGTLRVSNGGCLEIVDHASGLGDPSRIMNNGIIDVGSGCTFQVTRGGTASDIGLENLADSTLTGGGTIVVLDTNEVGIISSGKVAPGNSIGVLTLQVNASTRGTIALSGQLEIEIGGTGGAGVGHDQIVFVNTTADKNQSIGGDLQVQLLDGFVPDPSDEFVVASIPDGYNGTFNSGSIVCVSGGGTFDINYNANNVTLTNYQQGAVVLGDVNLDCSVNLLDVDPFIDRISTGTYQAEADVNQDGVVNLLDVGPFIGLLGG